RRPIAGERLRRRKLHALRLIRNRLPVGPPCRFDAPAQFSKFRFRDIHLKRTNCILVSCLHATLLGSSGLGHGILLLSSFRFVALWAPRAPRVHSPFFPFTVQQKKFLFCWGGGGGGRKRGGDTTDEPPPPPYQPSSNAGDGPRPGFSYWFTASRTP